MVRRQTKLAYQMRVRITVGLICVWLAAAVAFAANDEISDDADALLPVYLYFADSARPCLTAEERPAMAAKDPAAFCRLLVTSLIQGPTTGLARTIPPDTAVRAVFIEGKTAYVDFSGEIRASHPGGIVGELMTVYSIVNTLVLNMDDVDQVKFLIEGRDADTLTGHIDIRSPLSADMMIIR